MRLGIIGTAGRKEDGAKLNKVIYELMCKTTRRIISGLEPNILQHEVTTLVSGGAAYADHVAVTLFTEGVVPNLHLNLACDFVARSKRFADDGSRDFRRNPGGTLNYYHSLFSTATQQPSLEQLHHVIYDKPKPASVQVTFGLHDRNTSIAADSDALLAMTFGEGPNVKPGGTKDTVDKFRKMKPHGIVYHLDLNKMVLWKEFKNCGLSA